MSADSFHKRIEDTMKCMNEVCDWQDFVSCVNDAGTSFEMKVEDFFMYENWLSSSQVSKAGKPLSDNLEKVHQVGILKEVTAMKYFRNTAFWYKNMFLPYCKEIL